MKVLIADDNLASQLMLKTTLGELGHELVVASDGNTACEIMLKPDAPKLAILDWMMPGMDGSEVCRKIREKKFADPAYLIILTIRDKTEDIIQGLKSGANDYIVKPYNVEELQVRVGVGCRVMEMQSLMSKQIKELQSALEHIKTLRGLLPICMYCKKVRNDKQYWQQVEGYISEHTDLQFSHGICPDCLKKYVQSATTDIQKENHLPL